MRRLNQAEMSSVERSHRGNEPDPRAALLRLPDDSAHLGGLLGDDKGGPSIGLCSRHDESLNPGFDEICGSLSEF
jgi:hypothetical protein